LGDLLCFKFEQRQRGILPLYCVLITFSVRSSSTTAIDFVDQTSVALVGIQPKEDDITSLSFQQSFIIIMAESYEDYERVRQRSPIKTFHVLSNK
jgi:hypothetical protein